MAYRLIYSEFWTDPKVIEEMTPEDRYFYLYLLTNPCTTACGIYQITKKQMAFELGYSRESIDSLMDRFENHHKLIKYNSSTRELAIKNWGKYNLNKGGKPVLDCLTKELEDVKDKELILYVSDKIFNQALKELYQGFYDTSTNRERIVPRYGYNTNTTTSTNTDTNTTTSTEEECSSGKGNIPVFKHFEKCGFGLLSPNFMDKVAADIEIYGADWVMKAAEKADEAGKHTYSYTKGILENWKAKGIDDKRGEKGGSDQQCIKELENEGLGFTV